MRRRPNPPVLDVLTPLLRATALPRRVRLPRPLDSPNRHPSDKFPTRKQRMQTQLLRGAKSAPGLPSTLSLTLQSAQLSICDSAQQSLTSPILNRVRTGIMAATMRNRTTTRPKIATSRPRVPWPRRAKLTTRARTSVVVFLPITKRTAQHSQTWNSRMRKCPMEGGEEEGSPRGT